MTGPTGTGSGSDNLILSRFDLERPGTVVVPLGGIVINTIAIVVPGVGFQLATIWHEWTAHNAGATAQNANFILRIDGVDVSGSAQYLEVGTVKRSGGCVFQGPVSAGNHTIQIVLIADVPPMSVAIGPDIVENSSLYVQVQRV